MPDAGQTNRGSFNVNKFDAPTLNPRRRVGREKMKTKDALSESRVDKSCVERNYIYRCEWPISDRLYKLVVVTITCNNHENLTCSITNHCNF